MTASHPVAPVLNESRPSYNIAFHEHPRYERRVQIEGVVYASHITAAQALNIPPRTLLNRCRSSYYPDWQILNLVDTVTMHVSAPSTPFDWSQFIQKNAILPQLPRRYYFKVPARLRSFPSRVEINGVVYCTRIKAARAFGVLEKTVTARILSSDPKWARWKDLREQDMALLEKRQHQHLEFLGSTDAQAQLYQLSQTRLPPKARPIVIHKRIYPTAAAARAKLGISSSSLWNRLNSSNYPNYWYLDEIGVCDDV